MIVIFVDCCKYSLNLMQRKQLNILGLSVSQTQSGAYALVLGEDEGNRRIPIIIGPVEAQAIAIQLEGLKYPRPLTHDLIKSMAVAFDINLKEVVIYKLEEGIFYSELFCIQGDKEVKIDSRTSDAIALAIRFNAPIFTSEEILKKAGIIAGIAKDSNDDEDIDNPLDFEDEDIIEKNSLANFTVKELNMMLKEAIAIEDYEKASEITNEIERRKK